MKDTLDDTFIGAHMLLEFADKHWTVYVQNMSIKNMIKHCNPKEKAYCQALRTPKW
jgi:hypothetical protein